ncbi:Glycosylphosphatidylinositol anchor biosynthesis protein 11 [Hanseniaspora uvarum DSM 2768]|nr:Glycosylphosphatidylinositol anchor biosynthesis protein 11 [Hanseniaspora uvarum DSM 2768]GMM40846.1 mannose-ethanolamine phosphotransferase [Hanseniaspora uvarum]
MNEIDLKQKSSILKNSKILKNRKKSVTFSEYDTVITPKIYNINNSESDEDINEYYKLLKHGQVILIKRNNKSNTKNKFSFKNLKDNLFNKDKKFNLKSLIFNLDYQITDPNSLVKINKTWKVIPFHLIFLLKYKYINENYNSITSLKYLLPLQILYLIFQIIPNIKYGKIKHKRNNFKLLIIMQCILLIPIISLLLTFFIIICGGSLKSFYETFLLACHINTISLPMIYILLKCNFKQVNLKKYYIILLLGNWLACFVIPLDWDRPWQVWPNSLVIGTYISGIVAYSLGIYI